MQAPRSIATSLKLPLLNVGASRTAVEVAEINRQIKRATYEQSVQTAFREVADALAVRGQLDAPLQAQTQLVSALPAQPGPDRAPVPSRCRHRP